MELSELTGKYSDNLEEIYAYSQIASIGLKNGIKYKERDIETYLITKLNDELDKVDKDIQKKWNLKCRFYLTDAEDRLYGKRGELISDNYYKVNTLEELNNKNFLDDLKGDINNHIKTNLKAYSKKYSLDDEKEKNILKDANIKVNKLVDDFSEKYLNNKTRDMVANFQNKWYEAYKNNDYDTANFFAGQIRRMYSIGIFKDDELRTKNMRTIYIDDILDEKREKGETVQLTPIEQQAIDEYMKPKDVNMFINELKQSLENK